MMAKRILYSLLLFTFMILLLASAGALTYRVKERDTLYSVSREFNVSTEQIKLANRLNSDVIRIGQELIIPNDFYVVAPGQGWYSVARNSGVQLDSLLRLNRLSRESVLQPYTKLRIPVDPNKQKVHVVQAGDSWEILEELYGLNRRQMQQYTGLPATSELQVGMEILLASGMIQRHLVVEGETLYSLARRYGVSVDQLMQYNALNTDVIRAGQTLRLSDPVIDNISSVDILQEIDTIANSSPPPLISSDEIKYAYFQPTNLYFVRPPSRNHQPSAHYAEPQIADVATDYADAIHLYANFKQDVQQLSKLSNALDGYKIMLDPGHGGYDPGAIGTAVIDGKTYYLVEDEYVYDIALRLYAILVRHGASVEMTILAPNHTIRHNETLESFVNQKNEVYNDKNETKRPVGGRWGLRKRVELTQRFLQGHELKKSIFMSLHADSGDVSGLILTQPRASSASIALANAVIEQFGHGKIMDGEYIVLKDNPAYASILVEVRTMGQEEAPALLDPNLRQKDAEALARAILEYAKNNR